MKQKIAIFISWVTLILAVGIIGVVIYWLNYPYKTLELLNQPFEVLTPTVKPGDMMVYHVDYCKYTELPAFVNRSFVDGIKFTELLTLSSNPSGCHELFATLLVPNIPPSTYYIKTVYQYKVNPIRTITIEATSSAFQVIN